MDFLDDFVGLALAIVFFVATLLLLPFVVLALELVVLVVGGLGMIVARTVFGYPWLVDARKRRSREIIEWEVDGYARSGEVVGEVAAALAQGQTDIRPQGAKEVAHLRDEATDAAALG